MLEADVIGFIIGWVLASVTVVVSMVTVVFILEWIGRNE